MRRWIWKAILLATVVMALAGTASAAEVRYPASGNDSIRYDLASGTVLGPVKKDGIESARILSEVNGQKITQIGENAFNGCGKLRTVEIESGITTVGMSAFNSCPILETVLFPDTVKTIDSFAFANCGKLNKVVLPTILETIKTGTFSQCKLLSSIYIGSVKDIEADAFSDTKVKFLHCDNAAGPTQMDNPPLPVHYTTRVPGLKTEPTCTNKGNQTYSYSCSTCKTAFNFSQVHPIPALGHLQGEEIAEVPATCVKTGTKAGHRCKREGCNGIADGVELIPINSSNHVNIVDIPKIDATCTEEGSEGGKKCRDCGKTTTEPTKISAKGHKYENCDTEERALKEPTCTEKGKVFTYDICTVCKEVKACKTCEELAADPEKKADYEAHLTAKHGLKEVDALGHKDGDAGYVVTKKPTCTDTGLEQWKVICSVCGEPCGEDSTGALDHLDREVPALGHDLAGGIETITKKPTCTEPGTKDISKQACKRDGCDYEQEAQTGVRIEPLGHDWDKAEDEIIKKATCKEEGQKKVGKQVCTRCKTEEGGTLEPIPKEAHTWTDPKPDESKKDEDRAATCGAEGVSHVIVTCTVCDTTEPQTIAIPATGEHAWGDWATTKQPTEAQEGEQKRTCSVCQKEDVMVLPATGKPGGSDKPDDPDKPGGSDKPEEAKTYRVDLIQGAGGYLYANQTTAKAGDTVTLTVTEDTGYELDMIRAIGGGSVLSLSNPSRDRYRFTMPAADVEVRATFERRSSGWSNAPGDGTNGDPRRTTDVMPTQNPSQSVPRADAWSQLFRDIPTSHWAAGEISWANQMGFMNGSNGRFNPDGAITHQQMWMVLARLTGANPANMTEARRWAVEHSFADGSSPDGAVTRHQVVTALYRCAHLMGSANRNTTSLAGYADSRTVPAVSRDAFAWAVANGIVGGTASGRLNPNGTLTRAQFAVILYRYCQRI